MKLCRKYRKLSVFLVISLVVHLIVVLSAPHPEPQRPSTSDCPKDYQAPKREHVKAQFQKWADQYRMDDGTFSTQQKDFCRVFEHMCMDQVGWEAHERWKRSQNTSLLWVERVHEDGRLHGATWIMCDMARMLSGQVK